VRDWKPRHHSNWLVGSDCDFLSQERIGGEEEMSGDGVFLMGLCMVMLVFIGIAWIIGTSDKMSRQDASLTEWCENFCKPNNYNETSCKVGCLGIRESEATK